MAGRSARGIGSGKKKWAIVNCNTMQRKKNEKKQIGIPISKHVWDVCPVRAVSFPALSRRRVGARTDNDITYLASPRYAVAMAPCETACALECQVLPSMGREASKRD